jgi:hypothetical protein
MYEIKQNQQILNANTYKVFYDGSKKVMVHPSLEGELIHVTYHGLGIILIPSTTIYDVQSGETIDTVKSLQDFLDSIKIIGWQGEFDSSVLYFPNAIIYYPQEKTIYRCINLSKGNIPTNTTYWQPIISVKEESVYATEQGDYAKAQGDYAKQNGDIINNFIIKGDYSPDIQYYPRNMIYFGNNTYINKVACKGIDPTDKTKWDIVVSSYKFKGDFLYTGIYVEGDIIHFGIEKAIYECIKPTTAGISPYNTDYWVKRVDISDLIVKVTDYVNDVTALYTAYDNGITITHNLNGYVECLVICQGSGFGNTGYGVSGYGQGNEQQLKTKLEYIDLNNVKIYLDVQFAGIPTITNVNANTWNITFSGENTVVKLLIKKFI